MKQFCLRFVLPATLAFTAFCGFAPAARAQGDEAHEALDKGVKVNGLTGADAQPWHIKANYTLYDPAKGSVIESGVFEEWSTGPWTWHRTYTEKKNTVSEWSVNRTQQMPQQPRLVRNRHTGAALGEPRR